MTGFIHPNLVTTEAARRCAELHAEAERYPAGEAETVHHAPSAVERSPRSGGHGRAGAAARDGADPHGVPVTARQASGALAPDEEKQTLGHGQFDDLTRSVVGEGGTRRAVLRVLAGAALGGLVARLGLAEDAEAKPRRKKRKQHKPGEKSQPTGGLQSEGKRNKKRKNKPKGKKQCSDIVPLCPKPCQEPRCDLATGKYVCQDMCREGWSCCNGLCEPPCTNGCMEDPNQACLCEKPPADEDVYCALEHLCGENPCPAGKEHDSATCTCGDTCLDATPNCNGCPAGRWSTPTTPTGAVPKRTTSPVRRGVARCASTACPVVPAGGVTSGLAVGLPGRAGSPAAPGSEPVPGGRFVSASGYGAAGRTRSPAVSVLVSTDGGLSASPLPALHASAGRARYAAPCPSACGADRPRTRCGAAP